MYFVSILLKAGLVPKLRGLQLLGNPLKFPPDTVVKSGVLAILEFLRQECSPSTVRPVEKLIYVKSTNGSDKIKKGKPKTHSSAISQRRLPSKVARPKAMSADLPSIMVKGYRHEMELVAPKPTPAPPHGTHSAVQYSTCHGWRTKTRQRNNEPAQLSQRGGEDISPLAQNISQTFNQSQNSISGRSLLLLCVLESHVREFQHNQPRNRLEEGFYQGYPTECQNSIIGITLKRVLAYVASLGRSE
uniref:Uncharacterized protein n=1 Tax=Timema genevievae TaxID=629358 RepID=A0A7R9K0R0_TIMGE|nr:unnamed protein product [Timema genevievae]